MSEKLEEKISKNKQNKRRISLKELSRVGTEFSRMTGIPFYDLLLKRISSQEWLEMTNIAAQWVEDTKDFKPETEHASICEDWYYFSKKSIKEREKLAKGLLEELSEDKKQINVYIPPYSRDVLDKISEWYHKKEVKLSYGDIVAIALDSLKKALDE